MPHGADDISFRCPIRDDGYNIYRLIADSPPLDVNSVYSYYVLSEHFRDTCVVAEYAGEQVGFLSAYRPPTHPDSLFVWQVAVDSAMRGRRIAWRMLQWLLARGDSSSLRWVEATVNPSNAASRGLFERLARDRGTEVREELFLDRAAFGPDGAHESEILLRVPLS